MSQIATIYRLPHSVVADVNKSQSSDVIRDTIFSKRDQGVEFEYDGYSLVMAAEYLSQVCKIPILDSTYNWISVALAAEGGAFLIVEHDLCQSFSDFLCALDVSTKDLDKFYEEFNETNSYDRGEAMLAGIRLFQRLSKETSEKDLFLICIL